jgi:ascorbate-specific PTS system EIIC-type component UlaA
MQTTGLILDIVGAVLLFVGTEVISGVLLKVIDHFKKGYGTYSAEKIPIALLAELSAKKDLSKLFTFFGLAFLVTGFLLQLFSIK